MEVITETSSSVPLLDNTSELFVKSCIAGTNLRIPGYCDNTRQLSSPINIIGSGDAPSEDIPPLGSSPVMRNAMVSRELLSCAEDFVDECHFDKIMVPTIVRKICDEGFPVCQFTSCRCRDNLHKIVPTRNYRGFSYADTLSFHEELTLNWTTYAKWIHPDHQHRIHNVWIRSTHAKEKSKKLESLRFLYDKNKVSSLRFISNSV